MALQTLLTVNNHTQRLPPQAFLQCNTGFGRAYGHGRIIGLYRTRTGNNGAALCAQALYIGAGLRAGNPLAFAAGHGGAAIQTRSEERRVGKEWRGRWWPDKL